MFEDSHSRAAARSRWPLAEIQGEGPWALVATCCRAGFVRLFMTEFEARAERLAGCGNARCCPDYGHTVTEVSLLPKDVPDLYPD
jgi:hypothetical protein